MIPRDEDYYSKSSNDDNDDDDNGGGNKHNRNVVNNYHTDAVENEVQNYDDMNDNDEYE